MVSIKAVAPNSPALSMVKALGRAHSKTLGFFPEGAFDEHAARRCILGAFDESDECIGYVLYRRKVDSIAIAHLCVDPKKTGRGVARALVEELSRLEGMYLGLELLCRRDFPANKVWPKLGFVVKGERVGHSHEGKLLNFWWRENHHKNLFSLIREDGKSAREDSRVLAVIDANVFFDLASARGTRRPESQALVADWLQDTLRLYVTEELFNEIDRNDDGEERRGLRKEANRFERCEPCGWDRINEICGELSTRLPAKSASDESDLRQLARAIAGNFPFFVTRDARILKEDEHVYRMHNITVITPSDLILHLDKLEREAQYQPRRFSGTTLHIGRVRTGQDELLANRLHNAKSGESRSFFLSRLREILATPNAIKCEWIADPKGDALAIFSQRRSGSGELQVPLLRVFPGPFAPTLARHLLFHCLKQAVLQECRALVITDPKLDSDTQHAVGLEPFLKTQHGYCVPPSLNEIATAETLVRQAQSIFQPYRFKHGLDSSNISPSELRENSRLAADFERTFWPVKVADAALPTYIIPIRPKWAQHLFDEGMASHDLFGARLDLAFNREAAYYRAARPFLEEPARILWYVSQDPNFGGTGQIRACSRLEEVVVDTPKALFRRFRRLGVYEWKNVLETAKGDVNGKLMALRFCDSEALRRPIPLKQAQKILKEFEVKTQFQSPTRIPPEAFARIYNASRS